jgi:UDP-N-acetylmuramate--alanine ligase
MDASGSAGHPMDGLAGRSVHFTGIGGCGMSGLALMIRAHGCSVTGSDSAASATTDALSDAGIAVHTGGPMEALPPGTDLLVHSAAVPASHPERALAAASGIETICYAHALGLTMQGRTGVSIAGTHGKSTTTAMLAHACIHAGLDPSFIVGARCEQIGGGSRNGGAHIPRGSMAGVPGILIAEACEFNRSFHHHRPTFALINNIEEDHLDVYASLDEIIGAFRDFANLLPPASAGGRLLIAHDGAHRRAVASGLRCAVSTFGWAPSADYRVQHDPVTRITSVSHDGEEILVWRAAFAGEHNALNAAAAGILAAWLGASRMAIEGALASFSGVDRRMQLIGERNLPSGGRARVFDDYGHHPTECEKTIGALRIAEQPRRLVCVFQPHQHSRTRFLLEQFAQSFTGADSVIVPDIYFVRDSESERERVSSTDLVERLRRRGVDAVHIPSFADIVERLETTCQDGDLVLVMGAGPVWQVAHEFVDRGRSIVPAPASAGGVPPSAAARDPGQ